MAAGEDFELIARLRDEFSAVMKRISSKTIKQANA